MEEQDTKIKWKNENRRVRNLQWFMVGIKKLKWDSYNVAIMPIATPSIINRLKIVNERETSLGMLPFEGIKL